MVGNVTVNCIGVDPRALKRLNAELDRKNLQLADKVREANEWAERYRELETRLSQAGDDSELSRKAEEYLHEGDLDNAGRILDQLLDPEERGIDRAAANHFNRALVFELQFRPSDALPHLEKAYRYRPEEVRYGGEYARVLLNQNEFQRAEPVCLATLDRVRRAAKETPSARQDDVPHALDQVAYLYVHTNRFEDAKAAYLEALNIYSHLAESNSTYLSDMARIAREMAGLYALSRWYEGAEKADQIALNIYRQLEKDDPATYRIDIATTLNSLAVVYGQTQRMKEAIAVGKEALDIRRRLANENRAYEPDVAQTLSSLAYLYRHTKQTTEAESACKEALEIYRRMAITNPSAYQSYLPTILNTLAGIYSDTTRMKEAETTYQEALDLGRQLAKMNPDDRGDVANTLRDLGLLYQTTQRTQEAEASYREALENYAPLVKANQNAYLPVFAATLSDLAGLYRATGRTKEAEAKFKIVLDMRRRLAKGNPSAYQPDLAQTLYDLGLLYASTHQTKEAEAAYLEALDIRRQLAKANPVANLVYVAQVLKGLGDLYQETQRVNEAKDALQDALETLREYQVALKPDSAEARFELGCAHIAQSKNERAIQDFDEAIRLRPDYAEAFANRGAAYTAKGEYDRAIQDYDQAIRLKPDNALVFWARANAKFYLGRFSYADADYKHSLELNPSQPYVVLLLHLARKRLGEDDAQDVALRATRLDSTQWPAPILKFYVGQITADQLLAAAANSDSEIDTGQHCEANFYVAEYALLRQDRVLAIARFRTARDICPKNYVEYHGAVAELKRLESGVQPTIKAQK